MKGQTFGLRFEIKQCAEGEDCNQGEILSGGNSSKELFCVARTNVFEIFGEGFRQLKLFWASLTLQGPECIDPAFSRSRIKRRGQREKVAISNRLPRFRIRACSALVRFEIERSGISFLLPLLFEEGLPFFIPSISRVLCRGKEFFS